jgi:hypothetical protein
MKIPFKTRLCHAFRRSLALKETIVPVFLAVLGLLADWGIRGQTQMLTELQITLLYVVVPVAAYYLVIFIYHFCSASLAIENEHLKNGRDVTKNINDGDLQKLLNGYILEDTFYFHAEMVQCKFYDDITSIESLRGTYDTIPVRCPANSIANIRFSYNFSRPNIGKTCLIWVKDGLGAEQTININDIYQEWPILVDDVSNFYVKLQYSDDYQIPDYASFRIEVKSWKKPQ